MAHALRYYKEIQQDNGQIIRLEIHKKDSTLPAVEIGGVLQALHLDIQGGADTIDAPIVKTSLTMTFVDAPDLEEGKKCGNWEEFYTPDSTMWKVVLKADGKTIWGGYVTPDSYQEDLRYRGSVTIIARDNIGHMQDFPFDMEGNADGMVTLQQLVNEAWAKIESPMVLDWRHEEDDAMYLLCDGVEAPQTYMNVSAFEDMNFFDAVEKALYSYGLVMRYTGSNRVTIMSLRDLPYQGKSSAPRAIEPTFLAHAQRELAPAARRIEESVKYEFDDGIQIPLAKGVTFTGVAYTVPFYSTNVFGETTTKNIPVHAIKNTDGEGWSNIPTSTLFFNPKKYTIRQTALAEDAERMLFLACNTDGSHSAVYRKTIVCNDFRINMTFGRPVERDDFGGVGYCYGFSDSEDREQSGIGSLSAKSVDCYISREQGGVQKFYDGHSWSDETIMLTLEVNERQCGIDVPLGELSGVAEVTLTIVDVKLNDKWDFSNGLGLYIPISAMNWGVSETASLCDKNNVNTVYVDTNNVIIDHSPELAPALDEVPFPAIIKNGIFVKSGNAYLPAKRWAWSGGTPQQMAVYNHLQLLCYHSKPNNIISGDIVYADFVNMEAIYEWGGANHLLVSGSYNFLNGRIESAVLREFKFYTDMWSDVSGTSLPDTEQNNRTTAESGSGAAKASTYSNETTVNIGGTGGGGTGGSSTLAGLLDVQVSSPSNGQALVYDSASGMWMNKTIEKGDKVTSSTIIAALGYTPFDSDAFTKSNIKNALGVADWALAANKPSYTWTEIGSRPTALSEFTNDLGLGSLAYKSSLVASDIPSLPWSKITIGKPTTLSGYGITDAYTQTQADARFLKLAGGTLTGTLYTKQIFAEGQVFLRMTSGDRFFRSRSIDAAGAVIAEIGFGVDSDGVNRGIYDYTNGRWLLVNYGDGRVVYQGDKFLVKTTEVYEPKDGGTTPIRLGGNVRIDGSIYLPNSGTIKMTNADGTKDVIVLQTNNANNIMFGQKTAAEGYDTYIYGNNLHFKINSGATELLTLTEGGNVGIGKTDPSFKLDINGQLNSANFVAGTALTSNPTESFQTTVFGSNDSLYFKMRLMRPGNANFGRVATPYAATLCLKSGDTHGYISIPYQESNKNKCYIGGGNADKINWKAALFHDNMDLLPVTDNSFAIGSASQRYKSLAVSDSVQIGDATLSWDAKAGMLKFDKGIYSTGAVTAGGKGSSNKYRLDSWAEWTVDSDGNVTDAKLLESSLSAKLGVELNKRLVALEDSSSIGTVSINVRSIASKSTMTNAEGITAGLTYDVVQNLLDGRYTKVLYKDDNGQEVWDYTASYSTDGTSLYFRQGDGADVHNSISMKRTSAVGVWTIIFTEI